MNWFALVKALAPAILAIIPGIPSTLIPVIVEGIGQAEAIVGAKGPQKLEHVVSAVATAMKAVEVLQPMSNPEQVEASVRVGTSAVVQAANAVQKTTS